MTRKPKSPLRGIFGWIAWGLFDLSDEASEHFRVVFGEVGHDLAVEGDIALFEGVDEFGVGDTHRADGGVDADRPDITGEALLGLAVAEGIAARMGDGLLGSALFGGAAEAITLGLSQDISAALKLCGSSFDA